MIVLSIPLALQAVLGAVFVLAGFLIALGLLIAPSLARGFQAEEDAWVEDFERRGGAST